MWPKEWYQHVLFLVQSKPQPTQLRYNLLRFVSRMRWSLPVKCKSSDLYRSVQDYRENEPKRFLEAPENAQIKDYLKRVFMHQGDF